MASEQWNMTSYAQDQEIPLCGEIILLRYPIGTIDFKHGPASTIASTNTSRVYKSISAASNTSTGNYRALKANLHHVLVVDVTHDKKNQRISIDFFPILSYSTPPGGITGDWVPDEWMRQRATDVERLNHLPIPARDWIPGPSPSPVAPTLSFGGWVNSRHSWLAMVVVRHEFPEIHKWGRHPNGPVLLDGASTINKLYGFLNIEIPRKTMELHVFCGLDGYYGLDTAHSVPPDECDESLTEEDIERALLGIDNIDPSTFWNFPGAPKELREIAQQRVRDATEEKIFKWTNDCYVGKNDNCYVGKNDNCYVGEKDDCYVGGEDDCYAGGENDCYVEGEDNCYVGGEGDCYAADEDEYDPKVFLNVRDVLFGEEACSED